MNLITFIVILALISLVISFTLTGSCRVSPHSKDLLSTNRYEPFAAASLGYTATATTKMDGPEMDNPSVPLDTKNVCGRVSGFDGIYCPTGASASLDIFSQAKSGPNCVSMGYSTSTGPLCMDEKQMKLLTTRGGNFA